MLITRSRALSILGVFASVSLGSAQSPESIPNWTAPPFWTPPRALALERFTKGGELEPLELEAVPTGPLPFFGIAPCRLLDTRPPANNPLDGDGIFGTDEIRTYTLPPNCGLPAGAQAVSLNVTATNTGSGAFGHIKIWPADQTEPNVSTLNYPGPGATLANAAIVPLSNTGAIKVKSGNSEADVILDVNGYYAPISIVNTVNGLSGAVTLAEGTNITITPSGNTLTIANTAPAPPAAWQLTGNAGTTPGTNFLGTTDNVALEIKVNNQRAMRFEPHVATMVPNVIGGSSTNSVTAGVYAATIGGGGFAPNLVTDSGGTVGGGSGNQAGDNAGTTTDRLSATVGGGSGNIASGDRATVGGGFNNAAGGLWSTIAGGSSNQAPAQHATVGGGGGNNVSQVAGTIAGGSNNSASFYAAVAGGFSNNASNNSAAIGGGGANTASGLHSTIPGGHANTASGSYSFAAGRQANAGHDGAFVWGDSTDASIASTATNQFVARATGGFRFIPSATVTCTLTDDTGWQCVGISDRNAKREFEPVDRRDTLDRLLAVPIQTWSYREQNPPVRHMGPMAQDFAAAYGLGADDKTINPVDANGVALAAIQGLYELVKEKDAEIDALRARLSKLEEKLE